MTSAMLNANCGIDLPEGVDSPSCSLFAWWYANLREDPDWQDLGGTVEPSDTIDNVKAKIQVHRDDGAVD